MQAFADALQESDPSQAAQRVRLHCHIIDEWHTGVAIEMPQGVLGIYRCQGRLWAAQILHRDLPLVDEASPHANPEVVALKMFGTREDVGALQNFATVAFLAATNPDLFDGCFEQWDPDSQRARKGSSEVAPQSPSLPSVTPDGGADRDDGITSLLNAVGAPPPEGLYRIRPRGLMLHAEQVSAYGEYIFLVCDVIGERESWNLEVVASQVWDSGDDPEDFLATQVVFPLGEDLEANALSHRIAGALRSNTGWLEGTPLDEEWVDDENVKFSMLFLAAYLAWCAISGDEDGVADAIRLYDRFPNAERPTNFEVAVRRAHA